MSVYKPKGSRFYQYDFQHKGSRFHGSTGQETRRKAEEVERARRETVAIAFARAAPGKEPEFTAVALAPTLDQAAQEWWESKGQYLGKPDQPKDVQARETRLAAAVAYVGADLRVDALRTADLARAMQRRRGTLTRGLGGSMKVVANATVNREVLDTIRPVIRRACKLAEIPAPPIDWGELRLPEPKPKPKHFDDGQVAAGIEALPTWWRYFARFQGRYGLRVTEMFFAPSDLDVAGRRVTLQDRKGDDDHILPLLDEDVAILAALKGRAEAAGLNHLWFRELKGGRLKSLSRSAAIGASRIAMRKSGLHAAKGAKGTHAWRHHAAMTFLRATGDLRGTQRLLGHADINSTLTYAHAMEDTLRNGLEAALKSRNSPEAAEVVADNLEQKQSGKA